MSRHCRLISPALRSSASLQNLGFEAIQNSSSHLGVRFRLSRPQRRHQGVGVGFDQPREFTPFIPPSPASLPPPKPPKQYPRLIKYGRRLLYLTLFGGTVYSIDRIFNYSAFIRSARTFYTGLVLTIDYKLNFKQSKGEKIGGLHLRSAERVFDVLEKNGGLYLKVGQAIAMQAAVLPPAFQQKFAKLFDNAPQVSYKEVIKVFKKEFNGLTPDDIFMPGSFETEAIASASIAQVHRARLKDGTPVAVKIQKPEIATWIHWDLVSWSIVMWLQSRFFDLNFYFVVPYIRDRLKSECDFKIEADNSERTRAFVQTEPTLRNKVYIPKIFSEFTTERILVAEWIDGVKLWDREAISGPWRGYDMVGKPIGRRRIQKTNQNMAQEFTSLFDQSPNVHHDTTVRRAGLGLSESDVMTTIIRLFACQMFYWGHVHCDPHPGNMFVRRKPNGQAEVVLIDHGLYVDMTEDMRKSYCEFWMALLTFDNAKIAAVAEKWGIGNTDLFASATLLRPYEGGDKSFTKSITGEDDPNGPGGSYEMNERMREGMKQFLEDSDKIPRELVFLGRSMRIIQGNNQLMGSPVNRIKETAMAASRGILFFQSKPGTKATWGEWWMAYWRYAIFRAIMITTDIAFFTARVRQMLSLGGGFEDELESRMKSMAREDWGIELNSNVFEG